MNKEAAESFMTPTVHLDRLVEGLTEAQQRAYRSMLNARVETAFRGRTFILYDIRERDAFVLEKLTIQDYECDDSNGASCEVRAERSGKVFTVDYTPCLIAPHHVFIFLPLHGKLRWSSRMSEVPKGSLGFPLVVRTHSRLHLREREVTYCETGVTFSQEFPHITGV